MFLFMALIIIETRVNSKKCLFHFNASQIQLCCFFDSWQTIDFMRIIVFISHLGSHTERMEKWKRVGGGGMREKTGGRRICLQSNCFGTLLVFSFLIEDHTRLESFYHWLRAPYFGGAAP